MCRLNQRVVIPCFDCFTKTSPDVKVGREGNIKNIQLSFILKVAEFPKLASKHGVSLNLPI